MLELQRLLHLNGSKPHVSTRENRRSEHTLIGEKVFKATLLKKKMVPDFGICHIASGTWKACYFNRQ